MKSPSEFPASRTSPLCDTSYLTPAAQRRKVIPPHWMKWGLWWTGAFTLLVLVLTLLSPMDEYVVATGVVRPADYRLSFSRTPGILESVEVADGAVVRKGQVLARLDGWEVRRQLSDLEGEIALTKAELELARTAQDTDPTGGATARIALLEKRIGTLDARRRFIQGDLARLEIVAPEGGVVLATARRMAGEKVDAGAPLFKITSGQASEVSLNASEDRVNLIKPGQKVRFRANNNPDRLAPFAVGRVTAVARDRDTAFADDGGGAPAGGFYRVSVAVEKSPYELANGATVNAEIILERRPFWRLLLLKAVQPAVAARK